MTISAESEGVVSSLNGGIATVEFFGSKANSLSSTVLATLASSITTVANDPQTKVIVLKSRGEKAFCAGASFDELKQIQDQRSAAEYFSGFARVILALRNAPTFVIARVHGKVVGGGLGLVAASDYAIATSGAAVRLSELNVGLAPMTIGPALERKIGISALSGLSIDTDWRDAAWSERVGLYNRVVLDIPSLDQEIAVLAERLNGYSKSAMVAWKKALWEGTPSWETMLSSRAEAVGALALANFQASNVLK